MSENVQDGTRLARFVLLAVVAASLSCGEATEEKEPARVRVAETKGTVEDREKSESAWRPAEIGRILEEDASVRTAAEATAHLDLPGGGLLEVDPESELSVKEVVRTENGSTSLPKTVLNQLQGIGFFRWDSKQGALSVETPHVVASVLGTSFVIEVTTTGTRVAVDEGTVKIAAGGEEKTLEKNQEALISEAATIEGPKPLPFGQAEPIHERLRAFTRRASAQRNKNFDATGQDR